MSDIIKTKLIIVGGGPAGLTAGIYAARAGLKPIIAVGGITRTQTPGGALMQTTEVENFPGFPNGGIGGPELVDRMKQQAEEFGAIIIHDFAFDFIFDDYIHQVSIGNKVYQANAIILCNGSTARHLEADDEKKYANQGISWCATCDAALPCFRNKDIVVIGGGDSAAEEALFISRFAKKVWMIVRKDTLRASKIMEDRLLQHPKIEILWNTRVVGYYGDCFLEGVKIVSEDEKSCIDCAGCFQAIGHVPNTEELVDTGLGLDDNGYIITKDNVYTNINGVFAAGDVVDHTYMQAITASGFGCMASIVAERWLSENTYD